MRKRKASQKRNKVFAVILVFILVLTGMLVYKLANVFSLLETREIYSRVIVSEINGFDINNSALIFGQIHPGGSASREIFLENNYNKSVIIRIYFRGSITKLSLGFDNDFVLKKNETKKIGFSVYAPEDADEGLYDGKVVIEVRRS